MTTRFKCVECGKLTAGRMPRVHGRHYGDGSERYPRRHKVGGKPCPGSYEYANWVTVGEDGREVRDELTERLRAAWPEMRR